LSITTSDLTTSVHKRKREKVSKPGGVPPSASGISIMQPSMKKTRPQTITTADIDEIPIESSSSSSSNKPNYLHVTDYVFKRLLSNALKGIDETNILTLLDTSEKLKYARTYAQLINDLFYLKMKDDYLT